MGAQFETFVVVTSGLVLSARQTLPTRMSAFLNLTESFILETVQVDHQHVIKVATQHNS